EIPSDLTAFLDRPCASLQWVPSARMLRDAEGIINGVAEGSLLFRIASERMALDLLAEALSQFDDAPAPSVDAPGCPARMAEIRQRLKERCSETFSISSFAREVGMSERSLQRAFRSSAGMAVAAYVRRCRLERARAALAEDAVSVTEAAAMAGYATPSSFATAFARQYGAPPSQARSVVSKAR
ncbi:MAG: AraC family transcriptional regulator, partial [Pseudomonadota bacterium]